VIGPSTATWLTWWYYSDFCRLFWKSRLEPPVIGWRVPRVGKLLLCCGESGCCVGGGGSVMGSVFWLDCLGVHCGVGYL
jgi:hypothetical protein